MCYLIREQQAGAEERGSTTLPPSLRLRPRWAGAAAVALIGGLAVAALVAPTPTSPLLSTRDAAPAPLATTAVAVPLAATAVAVPTASVVRQGSTPVDDGVPSASDVVKASMGDCHHGL